MGNGRLWGYFAGDKGRAVLTMNARDHDAGGTVVHLTLDEEERAWLLGKLSEPHPPELERRKQPARKRNGEERRRLLR
jgi:hypothetical protein